jgi:putative endonuclease
MLERLKAALHLQRGQQAEMQAQAYLVKQGLKPIGRNYRSRFGELDLIMQDGPSLVVVEVRYRKSAAFGSALETVTPAKQAKIIATTHQYLRDHHATDSRLRFDVVGISGDGSLQWIKDAFAQ